jgi:uncharacterized protein
VSTTPATDRQPAPTGADHAVESDTLVPTAMGDLHATIRVPAGSTPLPGLVLVDGSGDGDRDWGGRPEWLGEAGAVTLRHDKPGCGGSPGDWHRQTLDDRAQETLAALRVLRAHPSTAGMPVGLYGVSQGGWVSVLAAALRPDEVDLVITHCGPGTSPATQERERLEAWVRAEGVDGDELAIAMAWVDRRLALLRGTTPVEAILDEQARHAGARWYEVVVMAYDTAEDLAFIRGLIDFDPARVLPDVRCPVLTLLGGNDTVVPPASSLRVLAEHLPPDPRHGVAVLPGADHGLFVADPSPDIPRRDQLAPAYLPTVAAFLADLAR